MAIPVTTCPKCKGRGVVKDNASIAEERLTAREKAKDQAGKRISGTDVARRMDISKSMLWDLEHGQRTWTPKTIQAHKSAIAELKKL